MRNGLFLSVSVAFILSCSAILYFLGLKDPVRRSLKLRCPCPPARSSECLSQTDTAVLFAACNGGLQGNKNILCDFDVPVERQKTQ